MKVVWIQFANRTGKWQNVKEMNNITARQAAAECERLTIANPTKRFRWMCQSQFASY